jgi:hypothetical protein
MHRPIRRFEETGTISDDKYFARLRLEYIDLVVLKMRYDGYVPRFDIDPDWSLSYNGESYDFKLSVYGVYVGRKKAQCIQGKVGNSPVMFTQQTKLSEPSSVQASE